MEIAENLGGKDPTADLEMANTNPFYLARTSRTPESLFQGSLLERKKRHETDQNTFTMC